MQVKDLLVARVAKGDWSPGDIIPSEIHLAQQLNISQGTVRKAITELVESNVLRRKQGRGTYVAAHDDARALFHFFHIVDSAGNKVLPDCTSITCRQKRATRIESAKLKIANDERVICIERIRSLNNQPTVAETILLPSSLFGDFGKLKADELPNTLYKLYETSFGITIHRADEKLRAINASERDAKLMGIQPGMAILEIERIALTFDGTPVELRYSRCNTRQHHYENSIF